MTLSVRNYTVHDLGALGAFFERYLAVIPDAKLLSPEFYTYYPALEGGKNVFCVVDDAGSILGFAPLSPAPVEADYSEAPHFVWMVIVVLPELSESDQVREMLFAKVLDRARELAKHFSAGRRVRMGADYMVSQRADIAFLMSKGFVRDQGIYVMQRVLDDPSRDFLLPAGVTVQHWRMETEAERNQYLAALNHCFPDNPKDLATLQFLLQSPLWAGGTAVAAFAPDGALVASVLSYWNPDDRIGISDDVFVVPEWRGRGLAKYLVNASLSHLRGQGITKARLEVLIHNTPAVRVYQATGHEIVNEEVLLGLNIG